MADSLTRHETMHVDQDDAISLTSTVDEELDSDEEWSVESIQAEAIIDGETKYLINWTGYPLWECSWEPEGNLSEGLLRSWAESKKQPGHKRQCQRNIAAWRKASLDRLNSQLERHKRRNRKRAVLGLEQTTLAEERWEDGIAFLDAHPTGEESEGRDDASPRDPQRSNMSTTATSTPVILGLSSDSPDSISSETPSPSKTDTGSNGQSTQALSSPIDRPAPRRSSTMPTPASTRPVVVRSNSTTSAATSVSQAKPRTAPTAGALAFNQDANKSSKKVISGTSQRQSAARNTITPAVGNVFSGGTVRKQKRTLIDAAIDPETPRQHLKHRYQRLMEKGLRDREGVVAPPRLPTTLLSLDPSTLGQAVRKDSSDVSSPTRITRPPTPPRRSVPEVDLTTESSEIPGGNDLDGEQEASTNRRTRKVRFDDVPQIQVFTEVDSEDDLFVYQPPAPESPIFKVVKQEAQSPEAGPTSFQAVSGALKSAMKTSSVEEHRRRARSQEITKNAKIGPDTQKLLQLTFVGLPSREDNSWVNLFIDEEVLHFTHTCTAKDISPWLDASTLKTEQLCRGFITWRGDSEDIDAIADRLKLASRAMLCRRPEYCILVHASKCEDWNADGEELRTLSDASPLSFRVMQPSHVYEPSCLAPLSDPLPQSDQDPPPGVGPRVYHRLFGLNYDQLIPPLLRDRTKHPFFLAFPVSGNRDATFLAQWLRSCNPECEIYTSLLPGHWFRFIRAKTGVIIIDEDCIRAIRLFPGLHNLLHEPNTSIGFWMFSKALRPSCLFPGDSESIVDLGDLRIRRLFKSGTAFLITPSLLMSEPHESFRIVKWFYQSFIAAKEHSRLRKLVVCADIEDWLLGLLVEQARDTSPSVGVHVRVQTLNLIRECVAMSRNPSTGPLLFAPETIDGNDEQSLVNWFGWWSVMNIDHYRKFFVVGTSQAHAERMCRYIRPPKYSPLTTSHPDDAFAHVDQRSQRRQGQTGGAPTGHQQRAAFEFIEDDEGKTLQRYLFDRAARCKVTPMVLYGYPISYWNPDMSFHFRDYSSAFQTYQAIFNWLRPFQTSGNRSAPRMSSSVLGFFYTIKGRWDAADFPQDIKPSRHPWIALFRPANLTKKPWIATELLIWDVGSRTKLQDRDVYEEHLMDAQREWIKLVAEQNKTKNPELPLERVWLGGFNTAPTDYTEPLDVTLEQLDRMIDDVRHWAPARDEQLRDSGWKLVRPGCAPNIPSPEPMEVDTPEVDTPDDDESSTRIVFQPPRRMTPPGKTHSKNRLYEKTMEAQKHGPVDEMKYLFVPTLQWYGQQAAEGRGFEHIKVMRWETFVEDLKISKPDRAGAELT